MSEWSFFIDDNDGVPCDAMRHKTSGVVFYMPSPIRVYCTAVCSYPSTALGRKWSSLRHQEKARAEYERLLAAGEISMHCDFCRTEGRGFIRGLCPGCALLCWTCGEAATVSEIPSESYRAGDSYALPPATYCANCFEQAEARLRACLNTGNSGYGAEGISDEDIPF